MIVLQAEFNNCCIISLVRQLLWLACKEGVFCSEKDLDVETDRELGRIKKWYYLSFSIAFTIAEAINVPLGRTFVNKKPFVRANCDMTRERDRVVEPLSIYSNFQYFIPVSQLLVYPMINQYCDVSLLQHVMCQSLIWLCARSLL